MSEPGPCRFADWDALVDDAAERLAAAVRSGLEARGRASLALAGGSTPADIYRRLARQPLDWSRVTVMTTDERWVSTDAPDSNARLLRDTLMQGAAGVTRLIPLKDEGSASPEHAVGAAEAALSQAPWPLDAVLLGMGADGHFASLFPGSPVLAAGLDPTASARVLAVPAGTPAPLQPRLTLTLSAIVDARAILLVIRGPEKLAVIDQAGDLPIASLFRHAPVDMLWAP